MRAPLLFSASLPTYRQQKYMPNNKGDAEKGMVVFSETIIYHRRYFRGC